MARKYYAWNSQRKLKRLCISSARQILGFLLLKFLNLFNDMYAYTKIDFIVHRPNAWRNRKRFDFQELVSSKNWLFQRKIYLRKNLTNWIVNSHFLVTLFLCIIIIKSFSQRFYSKVWRISKLKSRNNDILNFVKST